MPASHDINRCAGGRRAHVGVDQQVTAGVDAEVTSERARTAPGDCQGGIQIDIAIGRSGADQRITRGADRCIDRECAGIKLHHQRRTSGQVGGRRLGFGHDARIVLNTIHAERGGLPHRH